MRPGIADIVIDTRGSYREHYNVTGFDWTGYTEARAEVRDRPEGDVLYISVSEVPSADGYIILDDVASTIDIFFSDAATAGMVGVRAAAWDLFLENTNGEDVIKFLKGKVAVDPSVTDPTSD